MYEQLTRTARSTGATEVNAAKSDVLIGPRGLCEKG
jgi:hypothetical protein